MFLTEEGVHANFRRLSGDNTSIFWIWPPFMSILKVELAAKVSGFPLTILQTKPSIFYQSSLQQQDRGENRCEQQIY